MYLYCLENNWDSHLGSRSTINNHRWKWLIVETVSMKFPQMGCQQLLVTKFSTARRAHVFRFHSALVLQVSVQRITPAILSSAVFALYSLLVPAFFPQVSMVRGLPGIGFTAHTALVQSAVRHASMSYCSRPPWNCLSVRCANVSSTFLSSRILLFSSFFVT